jgi:hypothetical protein
LKHRFIFSSFQSVVNNVVAFRVHAPGSGAMLLDIFANAVTPQEYLVKAKPNLT